MNHYYLFYNNQCIGPMSSAQIFNYPVTQDSQISLDGQNWQPLYAYPDLMAMLNQSGNSISQQDSKRITTGILALLLGWLGVQYFYIGRTGAGFLTILLTLISCGLWEIVTFIQGILILCMNDSEFKAKFIDTYKSFPIF